jgi:hypothetical protein
MIASSRRVIMASYLYTDTDLENTIEINGVKYVQDKFKPTQGCEEEINGEIVPIHKAKIYDGKVYNIDDLYKWLFSSSSNKTVPHSRRLFTQLELEEIKNACYCTFDETNVKDRFIDLLTKEYNFLSRPSDMSENQGYCVRRMRELKQERTEFIQCHPMLNSRSRVLELLHNCPHLQRQFHFWINMLPP